MDTATIARELAQAPAGLPCCQRSELATIIRLTGHVNDYGITISGTAPVASRSALLARGLERGWQVREETGMTLISPMARSHMRMLDLAVQAEAVDARGRAWHGLPVRVTHAGPCCAGAAWRGAWISAGTYQTRGRGRVTIECVHPVALALAGLARRAGIDAAISQDGIAITGNDAIARALTSLGAAKAAAHVPEEATHERTPSTGANLASANTLRSNEAAHKAAQAARDALEILGEAAPEHLREAAEARIQWPYDSLEQLGRRMTPVLNKDTVSGRLRRLNAMADKVRDGEDVRVYRPRQDKSDASAHH